MPSFAERYGHRSPRVAIQVDELDNDTRVALWNAIEGLTQVLSDRNYQDETRDRLLSYIWAVFFKKPLDEQPADKAIWISIKKTIFGAEWFDALDVLEHVVRRIDEVATSKYNELAEAVAGSVNDAFEAYLVGYRFIELRIAPIDSKQDVEAIEQGLADAAEFGGARVHLARAVDLLADRRSPDYANSIKESISAVQAICRSLTGEHTMGAALRQLESSGVHPHSALQGAWLKMYGWTSDASGIRHGSIVESDADQGLAKYMLITCSAFVSYLVGLVRDGR